MKGGKKKSFGTETVQSPSETVAGDIAGDNGVGSEQLSGGDLQVEQKERDDGEEEERVAGDEDEDEEQEDEEKVVEEEAGAADGDGEKPKLAEGFYEIETVRNRRIRKGKVQYLIKWRDWPETANTWEPVENLMTCYDFIEAYEESSRSGKQRSTRKRKRKQVVTPTPIKRKQQHQEECSPAAATYNVPAVKVRIIEERMPSSPPASLDAVNHVNSNGNDLISIEEDNVANGNDMELDSSVKEISEKNELDLKLSELKEVTATKETSADISGDGLTSGLSPANGTEILQSGRCTGAKRRKPASVRRFKQETTPGLVNDLHDPVTNTTSSPLVTFMKDGIQDHGFVSNVSGGKNKCDDSKDAYAITEIIKPMSYSASVSNGFQDVCVTFLAKRSDGNDVMVDNKFLKTNNPLLLINFYEKNLRYYATTTQ